MTLNPGSLSLSLSLPLYIYIYIYIYRPYVYIYIYRPIDPGLGLALRSIWLALRRLGSRLRPPTVGRHPPNKDP